MCAFTHVCMNTCKGIEKMMKMQKFIACVGDDLVMHSLLQIMHDWVYIIMLPDTIIGPFMMAKMIAIDIYIYININTHTFSVLYTHDNWHTH